jgi:hypothetical protein
LWFVADFFNDILAPWKGHLFIMGIPIVGAWRYLSFGEAVGSLILLGCLADVSGFPVSFGVTGMGQVILVILFQIQRDFWESLPHKEIILVFVINVLWHLGILLGALVGSFSPPTVFAGIIVSIVGTSILGIFYIKIAGLFFEEKGFSRFLWKKR